VHCVRNNIKSIRELVMIRNKKWGIGSTNILRRRIEQSYDGIHFEVENYFSKILAFWFSSFTLWLQMSEQTSCLKHKCVSVSFTLYCNKVLLLRLNSQLCNAIHFCQHCHQPWIPFLYSYVVHPTLRNVQFWFLFAKKI